ncbi:GxxExxY protein [Deltaproteobacteria bacterium TL4]
MNANGRKYVESDLVYRVAGCAMAVLNELGHGLREKTYERALCVEFRHQGVSYKQQQVYPVYYRDEHVDDYIPDLEVESRLIIEIKTVEKIIDEHIGQVLNYLRITGHEAGVIMNFKHAKLEWKKVVLQESRNP